MNIIKQLRENRGWSQEEFAKKVGVSKQAISQLETIGRKRQSKTLKKIALAFDVSVDDLMQNNHLFAEIQLLFQKYGMVAVKNEVMRTIAEKVAELEKQAKSVNDELAKLK